MFHRVLQALQSDSPRSVVVVSTIGALLATSWAVWLFRGSLPIYVVSTAARVEVTPGPFPVQAAVRGRLTAIHAGIGDEVVAGALLFELDSVAEQLELKSARRRIAALEVELAALRRQAQSMADAAAGLSQAARLGGLQAQARLREVRAAHGLVESSARDLTNLAKVGAVAQLEKQQATAQLEQLGAIRRSSQLDVSKKEAEAAIAQADRQAHVAGLEHEIAAQEGLRTALEVRVEVLEHDIERRKIRAMGAGRVGDIARLQAGAWVEAGDRLASVVPPGAFHVVAEFTPDAALGRIHAGLPTRVHLDGFPWTQFGMIDGEVIRVGSELREGLVRVELSIDHINPLIPLQHGLPGVAEVMVESCSPAEHIVRALGRW